MMSNYGRAMRLLLTKGGRRQEEVCPLLQVCPLYGTYDPMEEQADLPTPKLQVERRKDDSCTLCHMVFDQVS